MICSETFKQSFCTGQAQEPITRAFIHIKLKNLTPKVYTGLTFNLYKMIPHGNQTLGYNQLKHKIDYNKNFH